MGSEGPTWEVKLFSSSLICGAPPLAWGAAARAAAAAASAAGIPRLTEASTTYKHSCLSSVCLWFPAA